MADITPVVTEKYGQTYRTFWEAVTTANHTGVAVEQPGVTKRTVHAFGTWGGATLSIEGSMDGANFAILKNQAGNAVSLTADGVMDVYSNALYIRARLTVVGAGADVDVYLLSRAGE